MPRGNPSLRRHANGQAFVRIAGRNHYLGPWGSPGVAAKRDHLVGEWICAGRPRTWDGPVQARIPEGEEVTVAALCLAYLDFASGYYRKAGRPTSELQVLTDALDVIVEPPIGLLSASEFGPRVLREVRAAMIARGSVTRGKVKRQGKLARSTINGAVSRIRRAFRWAVSQEMIPAEVYGKLATVEGLKAGRSEARETEPVAPAPLEHVRAAQKLLAPERQAMVDLQLLTGMRPGEVVAMRARDITMAGQVWVYRPPGHKTEHHGRTREVLLGPQAQAIVRRFLRPNLEALLFAMRNGRPTTPARYLEAVKRACVRAGVPRWTPNQLRHTAATRIRRDHGLDVAQVILGHAGADVTQVYAEADRRRAEVVIGEIG